MAVVKDFQSYRKGRANKQNKAKLRPKGFVNPSEDVEDPEDGYDTATDADYGDSELSYEERIHSHRMGIFYRTVAIVAVVVISVVVIYLQWKSRVFSEMRVLSTAPILNSVGSEVTDLSGYVVQYSKDGVSCMDTSGNARWNQTYEMQNPIARKCEKVVAVGDYNGHMIYVANTDGPLGKIDTNLPIRDFCVASQGVVAAVLDDIDVTWIYLYDAEGNELANFKTTMKDSGYPIAVGISPNGQLVCVSYLSSGDSDIQTNVAFYNFGAVGQNEIDNFVGGYLYPNSVVPTVGFLNGKSIYAVSNDRIMFYTGDQVPALKVENLFGGEEARAIYSGNGHVGVVFHNTTEDGAYRLQIYNASGTLVTTKFFDMEYSDILFGSEQFIIYNDEQWMICNMDGSDKFVGDFPTKVRSVIPTSVASRFILVTGNAVDSVELR